jgi:eukaryotic-like serine/threonine-protein kinase
MALSAGTRLGSYEILGPLGSGGMGEVYRARDTRLERDVAIKALPAAFAQDPERVARFTREAKLLAAINHPNIAGIYGFEELDGSQYLILEFVEGETLAQRLSRGALPVEETIDVCRQIAVGLEAAHEAGVVHRDLKPGNVMLRPDGTVKVLDLGLAKAGSADSPAQSSDLSASPTIAAPPTAAGMILGTAAYMSPEQARGRAVDKRSDIWSFGCVLYECLTARQAFHGETVSDIIAAILKGDVNLGALPPSTPLGLRELIARCLCKDPRDRLRDIGEARVALGSIRPDGERKPAVPPPPVRRGVPVWAAASAALVLAAIAAGAALLFTPKPSPAPLRKLDLVATDIELDWFFTPQLSPDGSRIAYIAKNRVWVRALDQLEPRAVADVSGLTPLAWSPDSRMIVYNDGKQLRKVAVDGGAPIVICEVPGTGSVIGAAWSRAGTVAFAVWRGGMYQASASGGTPALLFDVNPAEAVDFHAPSWLPNGDLLYVVHWKDVGESLGERRLSLAVFDGTTRIPVPGDYGGSNPSPVVTASGKLLFLRRGANGGIWAVPYDVTRRRPTGEPRLVAPGAGSVSVADDGSLLYMEGQASEGPNELVWVDRAGKVVGTIGSPHPGLTGAALSPDGRRIAFSASRAGNGDIWVHDLARGLDTRITFSDADEVLPQWVGSSRLTYTEADKTGARIIAVNADGSGSQRLLAPPAGSGGQEAQVAPDGKSAVRIVADGARRRLRSSAVLADGTLGPPAPFLKFQPEPDVADISLAPDGRLVAYATDDPGQPDVFVTRYPGGEGQWQVSNEGGRRPRWAGKAGELFYVSGSGPLRRQMVGVRINPSLDPPVGPSTRLFDIDPRWLRFGEIFYDVTPDGTRFLMVSEARDAVRRPPRMVLVQNWEAEFNAAPDATRSR